MMKFWWIMLNHGFCSGISEELPLSWIWVLLFHPNFHLSCGVWRLSLGVNSECVCAGVSFTLGIERSGDNMVLSFTFIAVQVLEFTLFLWIMCSFIFSLKLPTSLVRFLIVAWNLNLWLIWACIIWSYGDWWINLKSFFLLFPSDEVKAFAYFGWICSWFELVSFEYYTMIFANFRNWFGFRIVLCRWLKGGELDLSTSWYHLTESVSPCGTCFT